MSLGAVGMVMGSSFHSLLIDGGSCWNWRGGKHLYANGLSIGICKHRGASSDCSSGGSGRIIAMVGHGPSARLS